MRILLVDDDAGVVQSLISILKSMPGYEVRVATNGERALENAASMGNVDVLVTDVVMEPMDGFSLREKVLEMYPHARTIFLSGYDLSDYAAQTEGHQVLSKPVDTDVLLAAIDRELASLPEPEAAPEPMTAGVQRPIGVPQSRMNPPAAPSPHVTRPVGVPQSAMTRAATGRPSGVQQGGRAISLGGHGNGHLPPEETQEMPVEAEAEEPPIEESSETETPAEEYSEEAAPEFTTVEVGESVDLTGQTLGAYQVLGLLGQGRWGSVYSAVQTAINRPVALKVLSTAQAEDTEMQARFIADARAKAAVQHPAILAVYEAGEAAGHFFYAHEYVEGWNLEQVREAGKKLDEGTTLKVLRVVSEGLAYLSTHRIPHVAPQPGSIYVGTDGAPRLANLATQTEEEKLTPPMEIRTLGRILLSVLPPLQTLKPGLRDLLKRMTQQGPQAIGAWGPLLQGIQAIEPKVVPVEAARISAQDRAAMAAVAELRKRKKRSLLINISSFLCLLAIIGVLCWKFLLGNKTRLYDEQIYVPAGEFIFSNGQKVNLPEFWIDQYEVTYGQYAEFVAFLQKNPTTEFDDPRQPPAKAASYHKPRNWDAYYGRAVQNIPVHGEPFDLSSPVMDIDWWDAAAFAKWKGRELPTEQEWEKAARGTKGFVYPWGDVPDPSKANSNAGADVDGFAFWNGVDKIKGDKSPFGVVGMAGNVAEWVSTWDPVKKLPVLKGGSFKSSDVRLDRRSELDPNHVDENVGFRTVTHKPPGKK